jgi:hypothetical protein
MSDLRDPLNPQSPDFSNPKPYVRPKSDPLYRDDEAGPSAMWGWVAGGVAVVLVLAFIFGMGDTTNTASNETVPATSPRVVTPAPSATPPATTGQAPVATPPSTTGQAPSAPLPPAR